MSGCRNLFGRGNGVACLEDTSGLYGKRILPPLRLDPGSNHPTKPLRALAGTPTGRDDTTYSLGVFVTGLSACSEKTGSRVKPVMTQYVAWWTCFGGTFPPSKILSSAFYFYFTTSSPFPDLL